jgi:5-methyltetrahydropteroyltriglutamate--homocysteine methyltransferase
MRRSDTGILTTHVGALPPPVDVWGNASITEAELQDAVREVVRQQRAAGIDIVNEGELTKGGNWVSYVNGRLGGFEPAKASDGATVSLLLRSKDWTDFAEYYKRAMERGTLFEETRTAPEQAGARRDWECTSPLTYQGQAALQREIDTMRASLGTVPASDAFLTSTAPASLEPGRVNKYYESDEEYVFALAEALRVEYEMIANAGFLLQVDDAWLAALWDRIGIPMGLEAYRRYCMIRVEALNHALRNIPEEQIRYHLCWGSWHGPHSQDIPLRDIVDVLLTVKAQTYLFEAANVRHEHEYQVWESVRLPAGKILAPGVVTHSTALIEHPELVSSRLQRFAKIVGRENVVGSTDCGLGLRCHPQIAWAKLKALADGARLATAALYGSRTTSLPAR